VGIPHPPAATQELHPSRTSLLWGPGFLLTHAPSTLNTSSRETLRGNGLSSAQCKTHSCLAPNLHYHMPRAQSCFWKESLLGQHPWAPLSARHSSTLALVTTALGESSSWFKFTLEEYMQLITAAYRFTSELCWNISAHERKIKCRKTVPL